MQDIHIFQSAPGKFSLEFLFKNINFFITEIANLIKCILQYTNISKG